VNYYHLCSGNKTVNWCFLGGNS